MRKSVALKTLLRSPIKTLLSFLLIAAASFALFSRVTDYMVTTREMKNARGLYHAVASLDNEVPDLPVIPEPIYSPDKTDGVVYGYFYITEDKPWLTEEGLKEFTSLPGVTLADTRYMTAGLVEDFKRIVGDGEYGGRVIFEATYEGYEDGASVPEDHICLKFDDVKVIASERSSEMEKSFMTQPVPLGDTSYAPSPYTREFYDRLEEGCRCLVMVDNTGFTYKGERYIYFRPHEIGEGALCVIDGQPDNYLETKQFARQRGWVDVINHNNTVYDVVYISDMRAIPRFNGQSLIISKGRLLTAEDTDGCVVSADFLEKFGLSVGERIRIRLGDQLCHGDAKAERETKENLAVVFDEKMIPEYVEMRALTIVGAYAAGKGNSVYGPSPNTIYVPSTLLPVEIPDDYKAKPGELSVFVEDAADIEEFYEAVHLFAEKVDLELEFSDRGWMDVKDSLAMGAFTSLLTTVLYVLGAALALFLAVYLYIGRNKKTYAIMRTLGVPAGVAAGSVALPFAAVSVPAASVGGIAGFVYARQTAERALLSMADTAPAGYVPNAKVSVGVIILCMMSEMLFVSLSSYFFLWGMKKTPPLLLLQEGAKGTSKTVGFCAAKMQTDAAVLAKPDMEKLSVLEEWMPRRKYGPVRHVTAYIWNHMRRGIGKTAVLLILAIVLAAGIGSFVLAKITYQDAFYGLGVKGEASDFTFTSVTDLSSSPLVKDFYCHSSFCARVEGTERDITMTITNDLVRNMGNDCTVKYAKGYGITTFEGTGQVCLVGKELADTLGISLGDDISVISDVMHFILRSGEGEDDATAGGYKAYKVIGIAEADDVNISNGIFAGIGSDLTKLFSMDFSVDHCEFTLADNERLDELDEILEKKRSRSEMYSPNPSYDLDAGGLADIARIRGLLDALFPIAVAAAVLIGLFGPFLVILQSAQEAAFLRVLGVTKKRARCMLAMVQVVLNIAGIALVLIGLFLYDTDRFARGAWMFAACFALYLLGGVCGAALAAVQVTRHKVLELLQVKE